MPQVRISLQRKTYEKAWLITARLFPTETVKELWDGRVRRGATVQVMAVVEEVVTVQIWPSIVTVGAEKLR